MIYTSGDNDIGGEGGDAVTDEKVARFRQHFPVKPLQNIPGTSINVIAANVLSQKASEFEALPVKKEDEFRILISHFSLMPATYRSVLLGRDCRNITKVKISLGYHFLVVSLVKLW